MKLISAFVLSSANAFTATLTYQPSPYKGTDVWITNYYSYNDDYGVNNSRLTVGGWGDVYQTAIRFDVEGLPKNPTKVILALYAYPANDGSTPVAMNVARLASEWNEDSGWYNTAWSGYYLGSVPAPTLNAWNGMILTQAYSLWRSTPSVNKGVLLMPQANNNRFNHYFSSDHPTKWVRPYLHITYDENVTPPNFRLPLPGGRKWVVTTEIGGGDAAFPGNIDVWHTNAKNGYFSLDFGSGSIPAYFGEIPIYASASGKVIEVSHNEYNGNYVFINHSGGSNRTTGFVTNYLHMKYWPSVSVGQIVEQGQLLGYMGNTGESTGIHLHFCIYYNGQSSSSVDELSYTKLEGMCLKQYQTETDSSGKRIENSYYLSTNRQ